MPHVDVGKILKSKIWVAASGRFEKPTKLI